MAAIAVRADDTVFVMTEDFEFVCDHREAFIDRACCPAVMGLIECGCGGRDSVVCPADRCTGIMDHEVDQLFAKLQGEN